MRREIDAALIFLQEIRYFQHERLQPEMPKPSRNITFVEGLDPRTKFFVAFLLAAQTLLFNSIETIATTSLIILLAVIASRGTMLTLIVRVRTIVWFLVIITSVNMFTVGGDILFELKGLMATKEGLALGLRPL